MDAEHLLVFPDRDVAEEVADDLRFDDLDEVRIVRESLAGEGDSEDSPDGEWAVYVRTPDEPTYAERFEAIVAEHGGWYDRSPGRATDRAAPLPSSRAERGRARRRAGRRRSGIRHHPAVLEPEWNRLNFGTVVLGDLTPLQEHAWIFS